ncbi:hypothetical protein N750_16745 [Legionella pneumophila str. Leg01/53]|nr:hypothetical protein N750_16745 [Legionella pneumophila str. Leg01/53]ERI47072.1 hypothetical protein N749_15700 [Legionella pneumophila str. Leg01/20]
MKQQKYVARFVLKKSHLSVFVLDMEVVAAVEVIAPHLIRHLRKRQAKVKIGL